MNDPPSHGGDGRGGDLNDPPSHGGDGTGVIWVSFSPGGAWEGGHREPAGACGEALVYDGGCRAGGGAGASLWSGERRGWCGRRGWYTGRR